MGKRRAAQTQAQTKDTKKSKISKKPEQKSQEHHHEPEKLQNNQKKKPQKSSDFVFFTGAFYDKLHEFTNLYHDFLKVKTSSTGDFTIDAELEETTKKVQEKIQKAASQIFKHQLQETEAWIQSEIQKIDDQIKVIDKAYESNRESLMKTGAFTEDEVRKQLSPIQGKIGAKKETREKYEQLMARSRQIYE